MKLRTLFTTAALSVVMASTAFASIAVTINGTALEMDAQPTVVEGRTLVPMRAIFENLGAEIVWDGAARTVTATSGETVIVLTVDSNVVTVNGEETTIDVPAQIIDGRTMVPVRFVAQSLDCEVVWDAEGRQVIITKEVAEGETTEGEATEGTEEVTEETTEETTTEGTTDETVTA